MLVYVGPGRKPKLFVFSCKGSNVLITMYLLQVKIAWYESNEIIMNNRYFFWYSLMLGKTEVISEYLGYELLQKTVVLTSLI